MLQTSWSHFQKCLSYSKQNFKKVNYGKLNSLIIGKDLLQNGYCFYKQTDINSVNDIKTEHIKIFDSLPNIKYDKSLLIDYKDGTDSRQSFDDEIPVLSVIESAAKDEFVGYHCELIYENIFPRIVVFGCLSNSDYNSGMTPFTDTLKMYNEIKKTNPKFIDKLHKYGVTYWRCYSSDYSKNISNNSYKSWQKTFGYDKSKRDIENILANKSYNFEWIENDYLLTSNTKAAFVKLENDESIYFANTIICYHSHYFNGSNEFEDLMKNNPKYLPFHSTFGDGSEFSNEELELVYNTGHKFSICFNWESSDILILDNIKQIHGRCPVYGNRNMVAMFGIPMVRADGINVKFKGI